MRDSGHCVTAHLSQGSREVTQCLEQAMREILYSYSPFLAFLSPPIFCALSWGPQLPYGFDLLETHDSARYESLSESLQIPHAPPPQIRSLTLLSMLVFSGIMYPNPILVQERKLRPWEVILERSPVLLMASFLNLPISFSWQRLCHLPQYLGSYLRMIFESSLIFIPFTLSVTKS